MTDRELLELAAKAAWIELAEWNVGLNSGRGAFFLVQSGNCWNPLTDDGDALRLAVKLQMEVVNTDNEAFVATADENQVRIYHGNDPYAATRRAIVRAAAEIGKEIK